jgi:class 3 adenylate cyclase
MLRRDCSACGQLNPAEAKFCGKCGQRLKSLNDQIDLEAGHSRDPPTSAPERRQLTVMFCDLVGSTGLSARLDPEDLRSLIGAYRSGVADAVARFEGFIARYMGDGILVFFGYPVAHEDNAERAVRAGLAAVAEVERVSASARMALQARVSIATGVVVVGGQIGRGETQEIDVVGETPNLAAKLQIAANPGPGHNRGQHASATRADVRLPGAWPHRSQRIAPTGRGLAGAGRVDWR